MACNGGRAVKPALHNDLIRRIQRVSKERNPLSTWKPTREFNRLDRRPIHQEAEGRPGHWIGHPGCLGPEMVNTAGRDSKIPPSASYSTRREHGLPGRRYRRYSVYEWWPGFGRGVA